MKWIVILCIVMVGCCPTITEMAPKVITKRDSVTVFISDTIFVPQRIDTLKMDVQSLCDSLFARKSVLLTDSGAAVTIRIDVDDSGSANFVATCDSLQLVVDSLRQITHITDTIEITNTNVVTKYKKRKGKWWMWLLVGAFAGLLTSILIRR